MTAPHLIDPQGDVDILLCKTDDTWSVDQGFVIPSAPPDLNYRSGLILVHKDNKRKKGQRHTATSAWAFTEERPSQPDPVQDVIGEALAEDEDEHPPLNSVPNETLVRIRVSSKHLILASSYFKLNLESELQEGHALRSHGRVELTMEGKDVHTMLLIMNIIHSRFRQLPSSIDLNALTKVAVLVDYLQCHEAVEPFAEMWIQKLEEDVPGTYSKALIQWLCISLVFQKKSLFNDVTRKVLRQARGSISTVNLPIRDNIEDELNRKRSTAITKLLSGLEKILNDLLYDRSKCDYNCNALRYGTIAKELAHRSLYAPQPQEPYIGYSFEDIISSITHIPDSPCRSQEQRSLFGSACSSISQITSLINQIQVTLDGLSLDDFRC